MKLLKKDIIKRRITDAREKLGLTQAQLAEDAGVTPAAICQIEKGDRIPTIPVLHRIAQVLQVSLDYLAGQKNSVELGDALQNHELGALFRKYKELSPEDKKVIDRILKNMPKKK